MTNIPSVAAEMSHGSGRDGIRKENDMNDIIRGEEIEQITRNIFSDLEGGKRIDEINIYNKPNKTEVHELIQDLFGIIYPGYFRDRSYII